MKLGPRIKELRLERQKIIKEIACETGLTSSFISQVEKDKIMPSLKSLTKIAKALQIPVMLFFTSTDTNSTITHKEKRKKIVLPRSDTIYEVLSSLSTKIEFLLARVGPGKSGDLEMVPHEGEEHIYVLQGKIEIRVGDQVHILEEGDSIYFQSMIPHKISKNAGDKEAILIIAQTPTF